MKRTKAKILSVFLSLCMIISCMAGMSLTAYAADEVSENISLVASQSAHLTTISGTHYSVSCGYMEASDGGMTVNSSGALTINARKGETITKVVLTYSWGNNKGTLSASAGTFDGNATVSGINAQQVTIRSSSTAGVKISAVTVYFEGSLSNPTVTLSGGANATSSGGLLTQSYLPGAMDTVTYTALTGATFPEFEKITQNGITVERTSETVVTVSGTPTANTEITVPDAESSSKIVTWGSSVINNIDDNYTDTTNGITLTKSGSGYAFLDYGDWMTSGDVTLNFTTTTGKFSSIEIVASTIYDGGNWTKDGNKLKWNGTPSNSVSLSGSGLYLEGVSSINFVIEMPADLSNATVTLGADNTVSSVTVGGNEITDFSEFDITYGTDDSHTATTPPTADGTYYAYVAAKTTSENYTGTAKSAAFSISSHAHSFTYSASGATITANCSAADCPLTDHKATLTIVAPTLTTYGGTGEAAATLTGLDAFNAATGKSVATTDIKYVGRAGTTYAESATAPTSAGKYTAKITVEEKTASVDYEIAKADPGTPTVTMSDYTYGGTVSTPSIGTYSGGGTVTYYYNTTDSTEGGTAWTGITATTLDAATYYMYAVIAGSDNYSSYTTATTSFTVSPGSQTAPAAPTKASATTSSITLNAITNGQYKCGTGEWQDSPTFTGLSQNTSYTFYQRLKATTNYNASPASEGAAISTSNHTHTWGYEANGATITASCNGTGTCDITTGLTLTIIAPTSLTYDGTAKAATLSTGYNTTAFPDTYTITYTKQGDTSFTGTPTAAGTYTASVTAGTATASVTYTIAPKTVSNPTIEIAPETYTYTGQPQVPTTITVKDGTTTIDPNEYTATVTNNVNAGTNTALITITDKEGGNYTVNGTKYFTIGNATITAAASDVNTAYDGEAHGIAVNVTAPTTGYTIKYGSTEGTYTLTTSPTITNVADSPLTVYYKVTADNYNDFTGSATVTITKASQSAPVVSSTNETIEGKSDGTITGVTAAMEYKLSTEDGYTPVADGATKIEGLAAGTYNVRYAEDANHEASPAADVVINVGSKITVQFDADGGTPEPASQQFTYGQKVSKPETDPEKEGHTFKFWSADGETEYDFSTALTANITLKAIYKANSYTISFDTDGGSKIAAITQDYGTAVTKPADPTKTGYTFVEWDKEIPATMPAEDITVKAKWTANKYTITFDTDGGSKIAAITQDYGTAVTKPADPTKTGYTFSGWDKDIPATMPAENMTIKAKWTINQYTITFDTAGGTPIAPITQDYGTPVTAPAAPTRDGYAFTGWDKVIPATMPAENITITATWTSTAPRPYIPSYTPPATTTTTTTTTTDTTPDITKYTITGEQDEINASDLSWDAIPDASAYSLYVKVDGKYVFVQDLGKATGADIVLGSNGKYYVSTGGDYTIYEYNKKTGKLDKTGTLKASKIESIVKANNVTEDFMVKYTKNGKESAEKDSYKVSVKIYYKPAVKITANKGSISLKWDKVPGATKYRVYKYVNGKLKLVTETTKRSVRINGTKSGKEYTYAVKAFINGKWTKVYTSDLASVKAK